MESHRERMEITLSGGKPWGFSIKGGTTNIKPITVSKLESHGKGEASGLRIGDIIICVNDVHLTGVRRDGVVELIKKAGDRLILSIERAFPMNTIDVPPQSWSSPCEGYNLDQRYRDPGPPHSPSGTNFQGGKHHNTGWYNERNTQKNNSMNDNQPAGYVFSNNSSSKQRQKQQVKEALKMAIAERKRDGLINSPPDIKRDRLSEKTRRSMTSSSSASDPSDKPTNHPNSSGVRRRHANKDASERPRSWHASKHPETEQEIKPPVLSSGDRGQPAPRSRRKSREWLESGDLRSTLDRNSSESLLTSSSEQLLVENGEAYPPQVPPRTQHGISRDRSSINSNPSLLDAFQVSPSARTGTFEYENLYSAHSHRSSQDSLNSSSISVKSYRLEGLSSDSKNIDSKSNVRIDGSAGNKLRSSGRYGEIWKMPQQAHRRAKSFDALSNDTPKPSGGSSQGRRSLEQSQPESPSRKSVNIPLKSPTQRIDSLAMKSPVISKIDDGGTVKSPHSQRDDGPVKSPVPRTENLPQKSPSPIRSRPEHSRSSHHKGRHVDTLISNFEKPPNDDRKPDKAAERRHSSESKSIIKRLHHHSTSSANFSATQHNTSIRSPPAGPNKYPVQSSGGSILGFYSGNDEFKTLPSRTDEYKKNIQGMSRKVLRETSFTRRDLELSPPHRAAVHEPKDFCFPPTFSAKRDDRLLPAGNSNGPVRSKSTSSLLETVVPSMVNIPVTREETNLLHGKQYCKSLSPPPSSLSHPNSTAEKPKDSPAHREEIVDKIGGRVIKRITGPLTKVPELHCEDKNNENQPPVNSHNHTSFHVKSPPPIPEHSPIHDIKSTPATPLKSPNVPVKSIKDDPAPEISPPPVVKPLPLSTLPTTQNTPALPNRDVEQTTAPTTSSVSSSSYSDVLTSSSPLPATSAYYQTSASKAKIIHLIQEKFEGGEIIDLENVETEEERNEKKIELLKRITKKLAALQQMKDMIRSEIKDNEQLGKSVKQLAEKLCSPRELERFKTFVEEIDKIFNLICSLSGRLARVENTLATLPEDADAEEKNGLLEKKRKLTSQHEEAEMLKENVDRRRENVSEILKAHMSSEEYADFEHYIKMKTDLISEQRDVDDKMRLGEEQMRELHDSLPEALQEEYPLSEQYQAFLASTGGEERQGSGQPGS